MKWIPVFAFTVSMALFLVIGCTKIDNGLSVPDDYNDQGRELIYAPERVEGENCCGWYLGFGSIPDFQKAIDDAIENGQEKYGVEYVVLADIIAWFETSDYGVYSSYCAKVTGWPACFVPDDDSLGYVMNDAPIKMFDGHSVYYHSSTGIENDFSTIEWTVKITEVDEISQK